MPIDFPNSPTTGQQYIYNNTVWQYNGYAWTVLGTNAGIGNYVTTFNGLTGAVTGLTTGSVGGTYGSIQFKSAQGLCGSSYFTISSGDNLAQPTEVFLISGATSDTAPYMTGDVESVGIELNLNFNGLGFDETGGPIIRSRGGYNDGAGIWSANLHFATPSTATSGGGAIYFHPTGLDAFIIAPTRVSSYIPIYAEAGYQISYNAIVSQTGTTYTFLYTDNGKVLTFNNSSAVTVTIPSGLNSGFNAMVIQLGTGQVGFTAAAGVTMNAYASGYKISGQHGAASIISYENNVYNVSGTLSV